MTSRRSTAVLRGLGSLAVAALLLIGVPIGLATLVGWPLPTTIPDSDTLSTAINTGITDTFIVNALAVVAWIAWAQLALAFLIEATAAFKGRQPRDLPIAPGLQAAAARLVAGIVMLVAPLQPEPPWVRWRLLSLEGWSHATGEVAGEADYASLLGSGEGTGGPSGAPGPFGGTWSWRDPADRATARIWDRDGAQVGQGRRYR